MPTTGANSVPDPLAGLAAPAVSGAVQPAINVSGNSSLPINPGIYSGITVAGNGRLTMNPGIYVIAGGGFSVSGNGAVAGSGVLIYNAGTSYPQAGGTFSPISLTGNAQVTLSAATTGAYAGLTLFQARDNTQPITMTSGDLTGMSGSVYAPSAPLTLSGNARLKNALLVARMNLSGNAEGPGSLIAARTSNTSRLPSASADGAANSIALETMATTTPLAPAWPAAAPSRAYFLDRTGGSAPANPFTPIEKGSNVGGVVGLNFALPNPTADNSLSKPEFVSAGSVDAGRFGEAERAQWQYLWDQVDAWLAVRRDPMK
jgi:hypothetical protein